VVGKETTKYSFAKLVFLQVSIPSGVNHNVFNINNLHF
jgi:hypothetical protein